MPELRRSQVVVYGAVAVALLLVGARAIRAEGESGEPAFAAAAQRPSFRRRRRPVGRAATSSSTSPARCAARRLPAAGGSRVEDAVERAGGASAGAQLEAINRAARLADGQQVVVPEAGPAGRRSRPRRGGEEGPISLGTATVEQLDTIDGIGPVTAAGHRRVPRPARRPLLGRPARPGAAGSARRRWSRCGRGCSPERPMRAPRPSLPVLLGIAVLVVALALGHSERDPRAGRGGARARDAGPRGGAGARLRARRGRGHRRRDGGRLPPRRASATCSRSRGQNVTLLALLAMPLLAALGIPLRERLSGCWR